MSEEDLAGPPPYDSASAVNETPLVPVTYKPLTKKGLSTLGRGPRRERARVEERNTQQEIRQGARQRSRTVNRLKFSSYRRETQSAAIFVQILSDAVMLQVPAGTRLGALNLSQRSHLGRTVTSNPEDPPPSHQGASCSSQY